MAAYNFYNPVPPASSASIPLIFPSDLAAANTPYVAFQFFSWNRASIITGGALTSSAGPIGLPMPKRSAEALRSVWSQSDDFMQGAQNMSTGGLSTADIAKAMAARAVADVELASMMAGAIANPFLTMLYKAPDLKRHSFTWNFAPRTQAESRTLLQITNTFRKRMLPTIGNAFASSLGVASVATLTYPDICQVWYGPPGSVGNYFNKFKLCAVEGVEIDRTAGGNPAVMVDGAPAMIGLNVNLVELDFWTSDNIDDSAQAYSNSAGG